MADPNPPVVPITIPPFVSADLGQTIKYILEQLASGGGGGVATSIAVDSAGDGDWDGFTTPSVIKVPDNNAVNLVLVNTIAGDAKFAFIQVREDGQLDIFADDFASGISFLPDGTITTSSEIIGSIVSGAVVKPASGGNFKSEDDTFGASGIITIGGNTITVKNGIITDWT